MLGQVSKKSEKFKPLKKQKQKKQNKNNLQASIPDLQKTVPRSCCNCHTIISNTQAANTVVMSSQHTQKRTAVLIIIQYRVVQIRIIVAFCNSLLTTITIKFNNCNVVKTTQPFITAENVFIYFIFLNNIQGLELLFNNLPARSAFSVSHTLQLKSSYPARRRRPLFENATEVMPHMILSCEQIINS